MCKYKGMTPTMGWRERAIVPLGDVSTQVWLNDKSIK